MIGIIAAMPSELKAITSQMEDTTEEKIAQMVFVKGKLAGLDTVAALSGVGKVAAAMASTLLCYLYKPQALIHVGVAGGLKDSQNVMDVIISDEIFQADFDTTPIDGPEGLGKTFYTNSNLSAAAVKAAQEMNISWEIGGIATQDIFLSNPDDFDKLMAKFPTAVCSEMEGGAVAQVAADFDVPFMILRTLSDVVVHEGNEMEFSEFEKKSSKLAGKIIRKILEVLEKENILDNLKAD